jgi:hypothetical protein
MIGFGARAASILPDLNSAFVDTRIVVPSVQDLAVCESAEEVANIPAPNENGVVGFESSAIFIPGPVLRNTIIELNSKDPFDLIPIIYRITRTFDQEHYTTLAETHADNLCAWLYGVKTGLIPETRYSSTLTTKRSKPFTSRGITIALLSRWN